MEISYIISDGCLNISIPAELVKTMMMIPKPKRDVLRKNDVLRIIADAGEGGITASQLTRKTQWLTLPDRMEILQDFLDKGIISKGRIDAKSKWSTAYTFLRSQESTEGLPQ
jgi:hypothetical protein